MRVGVAADHAGLGLKNLLVAALVPAPHDYGVYDEETVDYPDYARPLAQAVDCGELARGIAICGTGIGMAIVANRFTNVRAATIWNEESCLLARQHNDSNVLCLGARLLDHAQAVKWAQLWLDTPFSAEARHRRRVAKASAVLA